MYVTKTALIAHCIFIIVTAMIGIIFDIPLTWKEVGFLAFAIGFTTMFFTDKVVNKEKNEVIIYASAERLYSTTINVSEIKSVQTISFGDPVQWRLEIIKHNYNSPTHVVMKDQEEADHYCRLIQKAMQNNQYKKNINN